MTTLPNNPQIERPPIVAVLGHIDHGKSTLLDYIRKSNTVAEEAGGITQHLSAYEVIHEDKSGDEKKITFLDTPGHEAFQTQRERGARVADIAILVVSTEDGVKTQTLEALKAIQESEVPYIVALNKVDSPKADIEETLGSLAEHGIYVEGRGGGVPYVSVSAKTGEGIPDLLEMILLVAEVAELRADVTGNAQGVVIESHRDPQKGIAGTLVIRDGTLKKGMYVNAGGSVAPVRIMEDFAGNALEEATVSAPVQIIGWDSLPVAGTPFQTFATKKEAENDTESAPISSETQRTTIADDEERMILPVIIKADAMGSIDAVTHELTKRDDERVVLKIIRTDVGNINEGDIKAAGGDENTVIIGFNTTIDGGVQELADRQNITIATFSIIYELSEWLGEFIKERRPKVTVETTSGRAKILKYFSKTKNKQIIGGRVIEGALSVNDPVHVYRREEKVAEGTISGLQSQRAEVTSVSEEHEFGAQITCSLELAPGDIIEAYTSAVE